MIIPRQMLDGQLLPWGMWGEELKLLFVWWTMSHGAETQRRDPASRDRSCRARAGGGGLVAD